MGMYAIGRPSCEGGNAHLPRLVRRLGLREVVILSDNDTPGFTGATRLANQLPVPCCTVVPPAKDVRDFVKSGGTMDLISEMVSGMLWENPAVRATT
jgi:DNA primase